jgi:hypothetical protein
MATWRTIASTETDPDAPAVSSLFKALANNPVAIAEGASGAPKIQPNALSTSYIGVASFSNTAFGGWSGLLLANQLSIHVCPSIPAGNLGVLRARFSNDNGATWGAAQTTGVLLQPGGAAWHGPFEFLIDLDNGSYASASISGGSISQVTGSLTVPSGCNAMQLSATTGTAACVMFGYIMSGS